MRRKSFSPPLPTPPRRPRLALVAGTALSALLALLTLVCEERKTRFLERCAAAARAPHARCFSSLDSALSEVETRRAERPEGWASSDLCLASNSGGLWAERMESPRLRTLSCHAEAAELADDDAELEPQRRKLLW